MMQTQLKNHDNKTFNHTNFCAIYARANYSK
jgi:hypothetical protein